MNIAFFAASLVSSQNNASAVYCRGLLQALHQRGHGIIFYEPDVPERQTYRDIPVPDWAEVVVYPATEAAVYRMLETARSADVVVKAGDVGVFDQLLEREVLNLQDESTLIAFWDMNPAATLQRLSDDRNDPLRVLIPQYDVIFTYGGGSAVVEAYHALRAQNCVPVYHAFDPQTHHPVAASPVFGGMLGFLDDYLADHEARVDEFFFKAARRLPAEPLVLGGRGWRNHAPELANIRYLGELATQDHNAFYSGPMCVLNLRYQNSATSAYLPQSGLFEAAGAGACVITDDRHGSEMFEPGREILIARDGDEVVEHLLRLTSTHARILGNAARRRVLTEHTYTQRAAQVESVLYAGMIAELAVV